MSRASRSRRTVSARSSPKPSANKIGVLAIADGKVTYDKAGFADRPVPVAICLAITPNGKLALTVEQWQK